MSIKDVIILLGFCCFIAASSPSIGQSLEDDPQMILAENLFNNQDYGAALENYQNLAGRIFNEPYLKYKIGLCYFHSPNQKAKAIDYLKFALKNRTEKVPPEVYYYLGRLYHYTYNFDQAIEMFERYKKDERNFELVFIDTDRLIEMCYNGINILKMDKKEVEVTIIPPTVNTSFNDYAPLVSARSDFVTFSSDRPTESMHLVFGDRYVFIPEELRGEGEEVFTAYPRGIGWHSPELEDLKGKKIIPLSIYETANHATELLLFIGNDLSDGDIYITSQKRSRWLPPKKLGSNINSKYIERGACFAENGQAIYFSSNRPGGQGGFDLYVSLKNGKDWGIPINLGTVVNSKYDEVNPFMKSDEQHLFFSSDGHTSMGGLDVFETKRLGNYFTEWEKPQNLGFPINSTFDDDYFKQLPDGIHSYLSSNRIQIESIGEMDIIDVFKPVKSNPMAMVQGKLIVEKGNQRVAVSLKVINKHTREEITHVYDPDEETGEYFMILQPRQNYEMHILTGDGYDHIIDLTLPEDAYSYELNKHIVIEPYRLFDQKIGEKPNVEESNYVLTNINDVSEDRSIKYDVLVKLMERIVDAQDRKKALKINLLEEKNTFPSKTGPDPYYTPLLDQVRQALESENPEALRNLGKPNLKKSIVFAGTVENNRKLVMKHAITFEVGESLIHEEMQEEFVRLSKLLRKNNDLSVEIAYPSTGSALMGERVNAIYDFFSANAVLNHQLKKRRDTSGDIEMITIYLYEESQL